MREVSRQCPDSQGFDGVIGETNGIKLKSKNKTRI